MSFLPKPSTSHHSSHYNRRQLLKAGVDLGLGLSVWSSFGFGLSGCDSSNQGSSSNMLGSQGMMDINSSEEDEKTVHWWQQGNFAPVTELYADQLTVIGDLPPQLNGTYLRNGPNLSAGRSKHFFDGDGMVHAITLADGQAQKYQASYIRTPRYGVENPLPPSLHDYHCNVSISVVFADY